MANSPSTYGVQRVSFSNIPQQRLGEGDKDARLLNCFVEQLKSGDGKVQQEYLVGRGGLTYLYTSGPGTIQRGIYFYTNSVYTVTTGVLYKDGVAIQTLSTLFGPVGWIEFINDVAQRFLIMLDGTKGYVIDPVASTVTEITDPDFPTPHSIYGVFIDGYLCVVKADTADIYNSDLNNPLAWTAGNFISAEMATDHVAGLWKQANYIVAMGTESIEYFYNAGNTPGTPLARNPSAYHKTGQTSPHTVSAFEEQLIFEGKGINGAVTIYKLDGFKLSDIATEPVRRNLERGRSLGPTFSYGFTIRVKGHIFYVFTTFTDRTHVYDLQSGLWHEWTDHTGLARFPAYFATDYHQNRPLFLHEITGIVSQMDYDSGVDFVSESVSIPIPISAVTPKQDFGTMNRKFANRFTFVGDVPVSGVPTQLALSWSDDDYQTWTTPRPIPISNTMTSIQQLGSFRRRAFKLTYNEPYPFRMEGAELTINMGST